MSPEIGKHPGAPKLQAERGISVFTPVCFRRERAGCGEREVSQEGGRNPSPAPVDAAPPSKAEAANPLAPGARDPAKARETGRAG